MKAKLVRCRNCKKKIEPKSNSDQFTMLIKSILGVEAIKEHPFHPVRKWRFDYAIIEKKIAIEVEGGVFTQGRHTRGSGFMGDMEKYNQGTVMGWRIIRTTPTNLHSKNTLDLIAQLL